MRSFGTDSRLKGLPVSGGVALGQVCLFSEGRHNILPSYRVPPDGAARETIRLEEGIRVAAELLKALRADVARRIGPAEAEIFTVQKMILEDGSLYQKMVDAIEKDDLNAEMAVASALDSYEARLREVASEYIKDRASDIGEVKRRLLDVLRNVNPQFACFETEACRRGRNRIVVAEELTPRITLELDAAHTRAFVTERGGLTSHAAILARAFGIPAVSGIKGIHNRLSCGTELLVDGDTGDVVVWPGEKTLSRYPGLKKAVAKVLTPADPIEGFRVMANISLAEGTAGAKAMRAEGVGLYRTEFEFLSAGRQLGEDEQYERYASVTQAMEGLPVHFRLLDLGGDKNAAFLEMPHEENPSLGRRGVRFLLAHPEIFKGQARALVRASAHGPVHVMYPMVIDLDQFLRAKRVFCDAAKGLRAGEIAHGVMFEVPSACLQAGDLLRAADFASVGSNDLIQYLFAADRNNELVADDYAPEKPVFWSLIGRLAETAATLGKPLSICGELAGDPGHIPDILRCGVSSVSVSPRLIPRVRLAARQWLEGAAECRQGGG